MNVSEAAAHIKRSTPHWETPQLVLHAALKRWLHQRAISSNSNFNLLSYNKDVS